MIEYQALQGFFTNYLHEDWHLETADPIDLVADFIAEPNDAEGLVLIGEIRLLLREADSDERLREIVTELSARFDPGPHGATRQFLEAVADRTLQLLLAARRG